MGVDIGSGIEWDDPAPGFTVDLNAHGLLVHEASGFAERDISGSLLWDRDRSCERGREVTVRQSLGTAASGDLPGRRTTAVPSDGSTRNWAMACRCSGTASPARRGSGSASPEVGRTIRSAGGSARRPRPASTWALKPSTANDNEPEYGIAYRLTARW